MPQMRPFYYLPKGVDSVPRATSWAQGHRDAMTSPRGPEIAIVFAFKGWDSYAIEYADHYDSDIGSDSVIGRAWAEWGAALRGLLNGRLGRLDAGTLDNIITHNLEELGIRPDEF